MKKVLVTTMLVAFLGVCFVPNINAQNLSSPSFPWEESDSLPWEIKQESKIEREQRKQTRELKKQTREMGDIKRELRKEMRDIKRELRKMKRN